MSTKELIEEANKLLERSWEEHEKVLVKRMLDTMVSYKSLIPKSLKTDIKAMLIMANRIKNDYDDLVLKYNNTIQEMQENNTIQENKTDIEEIQKEQLQIDIISNELNAKINFDLQQI